MKQYLRDHGCGGFAYVRVQGAAPRTNTVLSMAILQNALYCESCATDSFYMDAPAVSFKDTLLEDVAEINWRAISHV